MPGYLRGRVPNTGRAACSFGITLHLLSTLGSSTVGPAQEFPSPDTFSGVGGTPVSARSMAGISAAHLCFLSASCLMGLFSLPSRALK